MYKVEYDKVAILNNKSIGNVSQGGGVAYMDCGLDKIEISLRAFLRNKKGKTYPIIKNINKINGDIVPGILP